MNKDKYIEQIETDNGNLQEKLKATEEKLDAAKQELEDLKHRFRFIYNRSNKTNSINSYKEEERFK